MDSINKLINFGLNRAADIIQNVDPELINNIIESSTNAIAKSHKQNADIIVNVASSVLQTGNKVAKELMEGSANLNNNLIDITQVLIKQLLPLNIDIKGTLDKKQVVISEQEINRYLSLKLKDLNEVKNFKLSVFDDNFISLKFDIHKFFNLTVSQNIQIQDFIINTKEAYINFKIDDEMMIEGNDFISKIIIYIIQLFFKNFFRNRILSELNKHNIQIDNSVVKIDLKKEVLNKLYLTNLSSILDKKLDPLIDNLVNSTLKIFLKDKKIFDLAQIINISTEKENILIDFKIKLPYLE